jgi:hypothetical protein
MNLSLLSRASTGSGLPALLVAATMALHGPASALPMGHYESWMLMLDSTPAMRSLAANYAVAQTWAVGGVVRRWEEPAAHGATLSRESAGLSVTHRLHRWNLPHAQANLWLLGAARRGQFAPRRGSRAHRLFFLGG